MRKIYLIAINTFREIMRDKILYTIFIFAILMILSAKAVGTISMKQEEKLVVDFGFAMIEIFNLIITLFVGSNLIFKEVEKKLVYFLFSKPISCTDFILGKFFGLSLVLLILNLIMSILFFLMAGFQLTYLLVLSFILLQSFLLLAVILFFSTITSPLITLFLSFLVYLIGHITINLRIFALYNGGSVFKWIAEIIYLAMPNLDLLNLKNQVIYEITFNATSLTVTVFYTVAYIALLLLLAITIFQKKEF
jgi:ABC-type transport system involved in multi-copper enzyme maturation permease subunit